MWHENWTDWMKNVGYKTLEELNPDGLGTWEYGIRKFRLEVRTQE